MNQSHWNDNNDQNQNDCTEYTSTQYPPREYILTQQASANRSAPRKNRGGRIALIAAITILCLSLCFAAGVIGTLVANSFYDGSGQHTASDANGGSSGTLPGFDTENSGLGKDANVTYADNANRNPLPEGERYKYLRLPFQFHQRELLREDFFVHLLQAGRLLQSQRILVVNQLSGSQYAFPDTHSCRSGAGAL